MLANLDPLAPQSIMRTLPTATISTFSAAIEPGDWALYARGLSGDVGIARVSVGSSDVSLTVTLKKGARIAGRFTSDGSPLQRDPRLRVEAVALDPSLRAQPESPA